MKNAKLLFALLSTAVLVSCGGSSNSDNLSDQRRVDVDRSIDLGFGDGFLWGGATASFQVEGTHPYFSTNALGEKVIDGYLDGKSRSKWDLFTESTTGAGTENERQGLNLSYGQRAYKAIDQYHLYEQDFDMMKDMNINSYRFSIAWTRIIPDDGGIITTADLDKMASLPTEDEVSAYLGGAGNADFTEPERTAAQAIINAHDADADIGFQTPYEGRFIRKPAWFYEAAADKLAAAETYFANGNAPPDELSVLTQNADGSFERVRLIIPDPADPTNVIETDVGVVADAGTFSYVMKDGYYPLNYKGIRHYRDMIDAMKLRGIDPIVTMFHWDMPMSLWQFTIRSWGDRSTLDYFEHYAEVLLDQYGDVVPYWLTVNEPFSDACVGDGIIGGVVLGKYPIDFISSFNEKVGFNINILTNCIAQVHNIFTGHARITKNVNEMKEGTYTSRWTGESLTLPNGDRAGETFASKVGIVIGASPADPDSNEPADIRAAEMFDRVWESMWLKPFAYYSAEGGEKAHSDYEDRTQPTSFENMNYVVVDSAEDPADLDNTGNFQYDEWAIWYFRQYGGYLVLEECAEDVANGLVEPAACRTAIPKSELVKDWKLMAETSLEFIGVNYYSRPQIAFIPEEHRIEHPEYNPDYSWFNINAFSKELSTTRYHAEEVGGSANGPFDPMGLYLGLSHLKHDFSVQDFNGRDPSKHKMEVIITETGSSYHKEKDGTNQESLNDDHEVHDYFRTRFLEGMFEAVWKAKDDGVNIVGMMPWSTFDNFEWTSGTKNRFGIVYIDYDSHTLDRYIKDSGIWYAEVAGKNALPAKK